MAHKNIDSWLNAYQNFTEEDQRIALERLIDKSTHKNIRFMRDGRENREKFNYETISSHRTALPTRFHLTIAT